MINDKDEIEERLDSIQEELPHAFQPNLDKEKIKTLSLEILDLSAEIVAYLNSQDLLSPWAKVHIIDVISSLNWGWLYAALSDLHLAICSSDEISPNNKYRQEITNLNSDDIINHIALFKKSLENG